MFFIRLSQLAVLAKILCLLMAKQVVMCGAVPSTVRSVSLYSTCSRGNITVIGRQVKAQQRSDLNAAFQKLTTQTDDFQMRMYIYAEKSKRYICFTKRWKMVAVPKKKRDKFYCMFSEVYSGRYLRYHSVHNKSRFIGFNRSGNPITSLKPTTNKRRMDCFNFIKVNPYSGVERHNEIVASKSGLKRLHEALRPGQSLAPGPPAPPHKQAQPAKRYPHQRLQGLQPLGVGGLLMNSLVPSESSALQDNRQLQTTQEQDSHPHRHKHIRHGHKSEAQRRREEPLLLGPNGSAAGGGGGGGGGGVGSSELLRAEAAAASSKY